MWIAYLALVAFFSAGTCFIILSGRLTRKELTIPVKEPKEFLLVYRKLHVQTIVRILFLIVLATGVIGLANYILWPPQDFWDRLFLIPFPMLALSFFLLGLDRFNLAYMSYVEELVAKKMRTI